MLDEEGMRRQIDEAMVNYFMALTGDPEALTWLLTHSESNLRELGEMMVKKQAEQPQRQLEDAYVSDSSNSLQE